MAQAQKHRSIKTFFVKGLLHFLLAFSLISAVMPQYARAGLFSTLLHFFSGEAEEQTASKLSFISLPLLGSAYGAGPRPDDSSQEGGSVMAEADFELITVQQNALVAPRNPLGVQESYHGEDEIVVYRVEPGDAPGLIARRFGVSLNTILWANNIKNPNFIKAGDELIILPVSGVRYEVKKDDTLESIVKKFKPKSADASDIPGLVADVASFNGLALHEALAADTVIIIPDGEIETIVRKPSEPKSVPASLPSSVSQGAGVPDIAGYYMRPISGGRKTRGMHGYNGIDLANSCGFPVAASAQGNVILVHSSGWNGGYGKYLVIKHPNGTQTLYAHLSAIHVQPGQWLYQGQQIGMIGSTGNSTGCHVHFEIRGARNPF